MQRIQVSHVLKPRGLRGEIKCSLFPQAAGEPKTVYIDDKAFNVLKYLEHGNFSFLTIEGVGSIEDAERLRGKSIKIDRSSLNLADDEILTSDLIGYQVFDESGGKLGIVKGVENFGSSDVIDCGDFSFPYEDQFVIETDTKKRTLVVRVF
ncbi:MAG: ribosome maturation factor RimM [Fibromonadaceae bacterium]|jgi:16S rRNA processing protein RimM|nr:ribosome maturation factor RimM [Fibromonadaceae bacterium]